MKKRQSKKINQEKERSIPYYKLILIGENGIGKTQIMRKFNNEEYQDNYFPTYGVDFRMVKINKDKGELSSEIQIIDIAGEKDKIHELVEGDLIKGVHAFLCVFNISDEFSVKKAVEIKNKYKNKLGAYGKEVLWYLIGTQKDLDIIGKQVPPKYKYEFKNYFEISAKDSKPEEFKKILDEVIGDVSLKILENRFITNKDEKQEDNNIDEDFLDAHGNVFDEDCKIS